MKIRFPAASGSRRGGRGGSLRDCPERVDYRLWDKADYRGDDLGFRLILVLK